MLRRHEDAPEQHRLRQLPAERAVADLDHHAGREVHGPPLHRLTQGVGQLLPAPHGGKRRGGGAGWIERKLTPTISSQDKLVEEFNFLKIQAVEPMATFMEYIT